MKTDPERSARIIEGHVVGDGGGSDTALGGLACQVRTMGSDRYEIGAWVKVHGLMEAFGSETLKAIVDAIIDGSDGN